MSLLQAGFGSSGDDYEITDSLRLRSSASAYLSRTPASAGNRRTWTLSWWAKRGALGSTGFTVFSAGTSASDTGELVIKYDNNYPDSLAIQTGSTNIRFTNALYRDPSAWHHVVVAFDTTQGTASNRTKVYVNGAQITSFNISNDLTQNTDTAVNNNVTQEIGVFARLNSQYLDGYLTEVQMIDGQQLTADDFGEYDANGTWKRKEYTGTHGTNGFYLPMKPTTQADGFNTVLYTGDGASASINGVGYSPDFVWIKDRDDTNHHRLYDTVRGSYQMLSSSQSAAEQSKGGGLTSFNSDGFSVGNDGSENNSGDDYVAWTWDAGNNQSSTGISSILYTAATADGTYDIKGFGFNPDLIWVKNRDNSERNFLFDTVRGVDSSKALVSNDTSAEGTNGISGTTISTIDDGFRIVESSINSGELYFNNRTYVAWGWDAGDGDPVSNTAGTINSTVKANTATGFSIVSYTGNGSVGATVGHGLGTTPSMIIIKKRSTTGNWITYHAGIGINKFVYLNLTGAASTASPTWGVSSTTFTLQQAYGDYNTNGATYIAYCFSEVSGVSKFDTYTGNGSTTGPVVTTGFRPGFVMTKRIDSTSNWMMFDTTRNPFNPVDDNLYANLSNAENNDPGLEVSDTGFQLKAAGGQINVSSGTYIYMAFKGSYSDYVSPLNTDGTIDSRVKANDTYGFSIASYVGTGANATIGHGLSAAPDLAIFKNRDDGNDDWWTYNSVSGATKFLRLNLTTAVGTSSVVFNNTEPTSTVFSIGTGSAINTNGDNHIAYFFRSVAGYSKIDSYTGTGSAGLSVTTGFRPAFVMTKRTDSTSNWNISDSRRSPTGTANTTALRANTTDTENTVGTAYVKFTDTGFEITGTSTETNANGGTYIYMAIADTADAVFNFDASGNKNNFDANNINSNAESESTYDLMKDTPSLVDENAANFATLNPLDVYPGRQFAVDGNLKWNDTSGGSWGRSTISVTSGKWYWEVSGFTTTNWFIGVSDGTKSITNYYAYYVGAPTALVYLINGNTYIAGSNASFISAIATTDVVGFVVDADAGSLAVYKNNVLQGTITGLSYGSYSPMVAPPAAGSCVYNFGQRPLAYTPPTGSKKLNTFNLSDSTIEDGSDYFTPVLYSGNSSTQSITGVGFQPDLVWTKDRNSYVHVTAVDAVRGAPLDLFTSAQNGDSNDHNGLTAFTADGFNLGSSTNHNVTGHSYVAWNWLAGNSTSTNTSGSVNSTVSVNTTAGFSIVGFTSPSSGSFTMGHGLGASPDLIIMKRRASTSNWGIFHSAVCTSEDNYFIFNSNALISYTDFWGAALPTSTVFGANVGASAIANEAMIAWCWRAVEGYSAFGKYTGNGSTDGTFVYTGFRPAYILVKSSSGASNNIQWNVYDTTRGTFNPIDEYTLVSTPDVESNSASTYYKADILSNGFKLRASGVYGVNQNNCVYAYAAFAENPFKNANAR